MRDEMTEIEATRRHLQDEKDASSLHILNVEKHNNSTRPCASLGELWPHSMQKGSRYRGARIVINQSQKHARRWRV
jgi:hypothetical protein